MAALRMLWRAGLRHRWGQALALVMLIGVGGGAVLATVAGASRTSSALRRFVRYSQPEDVYVIINPSGDPSQPGIVDRLLADRARLIHEPEVAEAGRAPYLFLSPDPQGAELGAVNPFAAADPHAFRTLDRPLLLKGRRARLDRPDEAVVDDLTASVRHLRVGSTITMWSFTAEQQNQAGQGGIGDISKPEGPAYRFRIVGIVRTADTVDAPPASAVRQAIYMGQGGLFLTPAFLDRFARDQATPAEGLPGMEGYRIRLRHGAADLASFQHRIRSYTNPADVHVGSDIEASAANAKRAIHLEAVALLIFAALAAIAVLLLVGQAVSRQVAADTAESPTLAALGLGRRPRLALPLLRVAIVGAAGAVLAVAIAVVLSPLAPVGLAHRAEIDPGLSVNLAVLGVGAAAIVVVVLLAALPPAWRAARAVSGEMLQQAPARPGLLVSSVAGSGLGPAATAGVGMSLERGRGLAFRASLVGAVAAVAGVVGAVTIGSSFHHLLVSPRQQGWTWDVVVGNPNNAQAFADDPSAETQYRAMVAKLAGNPFVGGFSGLATSDGFALDGRPVDVAGIDRRRGSVFPPIIEGRAPRRADEVVLGRKLLDRAHRVGQRLTLTAGGRRVTYTVVGVVLLPTAGDMGSSLSSGAVLTTDGLRRLAPGTPIAQFAVRFRPRANRAAALRSLDADFGREILLPFPGGEIGDLARVDFLPNALAALLVLMGIGALGLALASTVRRHRRDLAVLKAIGFTRGEVTGTVRWQATLLAVGAVVFGVPLGLVLGRTTWLVVSHGLGSVSPVRVPVPAVLAVAPVALVIANLLAAPPGWSAGRVPAAEALRTE